MTLEEKNRQALLNFIKYRKQKEAKEYAQGEFEYDEELGSYELKLYGDNSFRMGRVNNYI